MRSLELEEMPRVRKLSSRCNTLYRSLSAVTLTIYAGRGIALDRRCELVLCTALGAHAALDTQGMEPSAFVRVKNKIIIIK